MSPRCMAGSTEERLAEAGFTKGPIARPRAWRGERLVGGKNEDEFLCQAGCGYAKSSCI